jgi:hypothetical protein
MGSVKAHQHIDAVAEKRITGHMTKAKPITVEISHRALKSRINRALAHGRRQLRADRHRGDIRYIIIDTKKQAIVETGVDLDKLARKLEVLQPWERAPP